MMVEKVTRREVLQSMSVEDRILAITDETIYGQFWAERTDDGWVRLDAEEQIDTLESDEPGQGFTEPNVIRYLPSE